MKVFLNIFCCLLIFVFIKCNNTTTNNKMDEKQSNIFSNCDTILKGKRIVEKNIPVYRIDKSFYQFLDTIIKSEKKCPYYNQCSCGFSFIVEKSEGTLYLEVNTENIYTYDYSNCSGIFEYNGYRFCCENLIINELLHKTEAILKVKYLDLSDKKKSDVIDDRFSTWYFKYSKKKIILRGHHPCIM